MAQAKAECLAPTDDTGPANFAGASSSSGAGPGPVQPPAPPEPVPEDSQPPDEPAASSQAEPSQRWHQPHEWRTPKSIIDTLCPSEGKIHLDVHACRWRAIWKSKVFGSSLFGDTSWLSRQAALEEILDRLWNVSTERRPPSAYVSSIPSEAWQGLLDERPERPKKYLKR